MTVTPKVKITAKIIQISKKCVLANKVDRINKKLKDVHNLLYMMLGTFVTTHSQQKTTTNIMAVLQTYIVFNNI